AAVSRGRGRRYGPPVSVAFCAARREIGYPNIVPAPARRYHRRLSSPPPTLQGETRGTGSWPANTRASAMPWALPANSPRYFLCHLSFGAKRRIPQKGHTVLQKFLAALVPGSSENGIGSSL